MFFAEGDFAFDIKTSQKIPRKKCYKRPEDPHSVGWVRPHLFDLGAEYGPLKLECGLELPDVVIEYETYGKLSPQRDNAIFIMHALTGDAHVAGWDATANEKYRPWRCGVPGWWDNLVGPGLPFDTDRYFIICSNVLGSCYGSTGPASPNPKNHGRPYGADFPVVTIGDWVHAQVLLCDHLKIQKLHAVVGGSLGGQQALEWAVGYPDRLKKCVMLASGPNLPAQGLGFNYVEACTIESDPDYRHGNIYSKERVNNPLFAGAHGSANRSYYEIANRKMNGLSASRMLAHITYLSAAGMESKFGRKVQAVNYIPGAENLESSLMQAQKEFAVQGYLRHQGESFINRFDANSYLCINRALDSYDVAQKWGEGSLVKALSRVKAQMMVVSFSSDWLFPPASSNRIVLALLQNHYPVTSMDVQSNYGHDSFLVEEEKVTRFLRAFLGSQSLLAEEAADNGSNKRGGEQK